MDANKKSITPPEREQSHEEQFSPELEGFCFEFETILSQTDDAMTKKLGEAPICSELAQSPEERYFECVTLLEQITNNIGKKLERDPSIEKIVEQAREYQWGGMADGKEVALHISLLMLVENLKNARNTCQNPSMSRLFEALITRIETTLFVIPFSLENMRPFLSYEYPEDIQLLHTQVMSSQRTNKKLTDKLAKYSELLGIYRRSPSPRRAAEHPVAPRNDDKNPQKTGPSATKRQRN